MMYRKVGGIPGFYIREKLTTSRWLATKPCPIASRIRIEINVKLVVSCMIGIIYVMVQTDSTCDD